MHGETTRYKKQQIHLEIYNEYKIANNKSPIFPRQACQKKTQSRNAHRSVVDTPNVENQKSGESKLEI